MNKRWAANLSALIMTPTAFTLALALAFVFRIDFYQAMFISLFLALSSKHSIQVSLRGIGLSPWVILTELGMGLTWAGIALLMGALFHSVVNGWTAPRSAHWLGAFAYTTLTLVCAYGATGGLRRLAYRHSALAAPKTT